MTPASSARWDVAIIGSGPIGLTLANLLGTMGIRTLLVERNLTTVQEPRAVSIDDESLRTMQAAGVVEEVLRTVVPGYGSHYYTPGGICFAKVEPTGRPYGYPRRNAFRQPVLEGQLREALGRFDHVQTMYGCALDRYDTADNDVVLHLTGPDGDSRTIHAAYLVGCDGAASQVREQQCVQLEGTTFDERWLIVDLENNTNAIEHTKVFCDRRRPCITLPGPDRTRRFEFKLLPGETDAALLAPGVAEELIRTHGADPAATIRRKVVYRFHARVAPRWSFGRVLIAGDAAHLTPPFAGQGMNSGIRDAHNLAWKLAAVLRGTAGHGLLDSYEQERKDHIWQMIRLALRMGRIMSPPSWLHEVLTQAGLLALNLVPPARDYVAQMKYKPPPRFHAGFLLPDGKGRRSLVGRMLPQPTVRIAGGRMMLLDEVLGDGFALLAVTAEPAACFARFDHPIWRTLNVHQVAITTPKPVKPSPSGRGLGEGPPVGEEISGHRHRRPHPGPLPEGEGEARWIDVLDETGQLCAALAHYDGWALLLRPDHYVAATIPLADPGPVAERVAALLAATWPARAPSALPERKDAA